MTPWLVPGCPRTPVTTPLALGGLVGTGTALSPLCPSPTTSPQSRGDPLSPSRHQGRRLWLLPALCPSSHPSSPPHPLIVQTSQKIWATTPAPPPPLFAPELCIQAKHRVVSHQDVASSPHIQLAGLCFSPPASAPTGIGGRCGETREGTLLLHGGLLGLSQNLKKGKKKNTL